jgi:hypothetical protein
VTPDLAPALLPVRPRKSRDLSEARLAPKVHDESPS